MCGSCAEFFIQPLQQCFGDVDYLNVTYEYLVFTDERLILPYDVRHIADPIGCVLVEPYHDYPNFLRCVLLGKMSYDRERKTFKFVYPNTRKFLVLSDLREDESDNHEFVRVGPAFRAIIFETDSKSIDFVLSMWCPQWPKVAKEWPKRRRRYGWPTTAIIHEVVQNGCHVVNATHPSCKNNTKQWRLLFSVAEVILLQSWTKVQQIVY